MCGAGSTHGSCTVERYLYLNHDTVPSRIFQAPYCRKPHARLKDTGDGAAHIDLGNSIVGALQL